MAARSVQSSNSPPDLQKFNFQDQLTKRKKRLHPPTHTACRPQRGLPLASPSLSLGRKPKTGLQQQAQAVLTQPQQSQPACRVRLSAVLAQAGMQTGRSASAPSGLPQRPLCA